MPELAKAYVQIIPSAQGIQGKLSQVLNNEAGSAGESAGKFAGANLVSMIKSAIVAAGIGQALKSALSEGADLQQSLGGIETLFKDSANTVIENAKNAYQTAGMSANEYMETVTSFSASLLQGLSGDTGKAAEVADMALTDMSDNANKMGSSMESIQNAYQGFAKQNYTMLDNLKLGYGGTKTEMERLLADATKLSGVEYDIDNLSDVYEAIHVIQGEMDISGRTAEEVAEIAKRTGRTVDEQLGTTAKEAASTFSGSLASMKAAATNLLGNLSLGEDIGPSLNALNETVFTFVGGNLLPMVGNVLSGLPEVISGTLSMGIRGLNLASDNADAILQMGLDLVSEIATAIITNLPYLAEAAINLVSSFGISIMNADWIGIATNMISELRNMSEVAAGEIFGTDGSIIDAVASSIANNLPVVLERGVEIVTNIVTGILNNLPSVISSAGTILAGFLEFIASQLPSVASAGVTLILNLVNGIIQSLPDIASSAISVVGQLCSTFYEKAPDLIENGLTLIGELVAGIIQAYPDVIDSIVEIIGNIKNEFSSIDWAEVGKNVIDGIVNGLKNGLGSIASAAKEVAQNALNSMKARLDIHSPSGVFEDEVGEMIPLGVASGVEKKFGSVTAAMKSLSRATIGAFDADFGTSTNSYNSGTFDLYEFADYLINAILQMNKEQVEALKEGISGMKMIAREREIGRFLDDLGYVRG